MIIQTTQVKIDIPTYQNVLQHFQNFQSKEQTLEGYVEDNCQLTMLEIELLVSLVHHRSFLKHFAEYLVDFYKIRRFDTSKIVVFTYFLVLTPNEDLELFLAMKCAFKRKILEFLLQETNQITTALIGCKHFEDEYVLKQIIQPILTKNEFFHLLDQQLAISHSRDLIKKPNTIPDQLRLLQRPKGLPTAPLNTPIKTIFYANKVPKTNYSCDSTERKLAGEFEKNRLRARKLLETAKNLNANYCKTYEKPKEAEEARSEVRFKAKKAPNLNANKVEIKSNIAAILREGNLCLKEKEEEIKTIEVLLQGGASLEKYREAEETAKKEEQERFLEEVERKHLEGLLTFEEAILAKQKHIEYNKEKYKIFLEEREEFQRKIEEWREEEQEKMKELVRKGQEIKMNCKESEKRLKEDRKMTVNKMKEETKKILQEAYEKKQEELKKKIKLIEEIKNLHQLRNLEQKTKEETNFRVLCQMSVRELEENLQRVKKQMQEELERKRACIRWRRDRKRQMMDDVKNFIAQSRMSKKSVPNLNLDASKMAAKNNRRLEQLRTHLENVRETRKKAKSH